METKMDAQAFCNVIWQYNQNTIFIQVIHNLRWDYELYNTRNEKRRILSSEQFFI